MFYINGYFKHTNYFSIKLFLTPSEIRTWVFSLQLCLNIVYNSNCSATMASHNDGWIGCKKKWWLKQNRNKTNIKKSKNYPRFNSLSMAKRNSDQSIKIALYKWNELPEWNSKCIQSGMCTYILWGGWGAGGFELYLNVFVQATGQIVLWHLSKEN